MTPDALLAPLDALLVVPDALSAPLDADFARSEPVRVSKQEVLSRNRTVQRGESRLRVNHRAPAIDLPLFHLQNGGEGRGEEVLWRMTNVQ